MGKHDNEDGGSRRKSSKDPVAKCPAKKSPTKPCYLYKLTITEQWEEEKKPKPPKQRDRSAIEGDIKKCDQDLLDLQQKIDREHEKKKADKKKLEGFRKERDELQEKMMNLLLEFYRSDPKPPVERPRSKNREFSVVNYYPEEWGDHLEKSRAEMKRLGRELAELLKQWDSAHDEHEEIKSKLIGFDKEVQELARKKDKTKAALERQKRSTDERRDEWMEKKDAQPSSKRLVGKIDKRIKEKKAARAKEKYSKSDSKLDDCKAANNQAKQDYNRKVDEFNDLDEEEPEIYRKLQKIRSDIEAKSAELEGVEKTVLKLRNTLISPAVIQVVAGSKAPWYQGLEGKSHMDEQGKRHHKAAGKPDGTPKIIVQVDADNDKTGDPPHPKGWPWGPTEIKKYCGDKKPVLNGPGPHPYLDVGILPVPKQQEKEWPFPATEAHKKKHEFKIWQAKQFDDTLQVGIPILMSAWNMFVRVIRTIKEIFSKSPRLAQYTIRACACGFKPEGRTHNVARDLEADLEVYPSDSFEFSITTSSFAGISYSREVTRSDASRPAAETGQAQYESSGSQVEDTDTESFTTSAAFGNLSDTHSVTHITGTGGVEKDLVIEEDVTKRGFTTDIHRQTDDDYNNTFEGEAYSLDYNQTNTSDFTGVRKSDGVDISFTESGKIVSRTNEDGSIRDVDEYRQDSDFQVQESTYDSSTLDAGAERVTRVPPYPSSFFPMVPVDISFKRNDLEDDFTVHLKNAIGNLVWISRNAAAFAGRLSNWVPGYGFGFNFSFDILSGHFSYYKQWREHIDSRVYPYTKADLDITCFKVDLTLWGGVWVELLMLEFKIVAEIVLSGKVGVKGQWESTHPDAVVKQKRGFGPTGGVGAKVQIRLVVGSADWCTAAVGVRTGIEIEMMAWTQHEEGPHVTWDATFTGVVAFITARLILVGGWEFERKFCKEKKIAEKRWPELTDRDLLIQQSKEMDALTAEAVAEAEKMSVKSRRGRSKHRKQIRGKK